jgi:hypothetical protein
LFLAMTAMRAAHQAQRDCFITRIRDSRENFMGGFIWKQGRCKYIKLFLAAAFAAVASKKIERVGERRFYE